MVICQLFVLERLFFFNVQKFCSLVSCVIRQSPKRSIEKPDYKK